MKIDAVLNALRDGKRVYRSNWIEGSFLYLEKGYLRTLTPLMDGTSVIRQYEFDWKDLNAKNWIEPEAAA